MCTRDYKDYFMQPDEAPHRRYEALRSVFVEEEPMKSVCRAASLAVIWLLSSPALADDAKQHSAVKPVPQSGERWTNRHERFNARVKKGNVDLIFIGDSITHGWVGDGKRVWEKYYGKRNAVNLGINGDRTQHVLWRLDHGNIAGISPKARHDK